MSNSSGERMQPYLKHFFISSIVVGSFSYLYHLDLHMGSDVYRNSIFFFQSLSSLDFDIHNGPSYSWSPSCFYLPLQYQLENPVFIVISHFISNFKFVSFLSLMVFQIVPMIISPYDDSSTIQTIPTVVRNLHHASTPYLWTKNTQHFRSQVRDGDLRLNYKVFFFIRWRALIACEVSQISDVVGSFQNASYDHNIVFLLLSFIRISIHPIKNIICYYFNLFMYIRKILLSGSLMDSF